MVFMRHVLNLPLGWAGVDLFFVLSGFLVTGILRKTRNEPAFWSRFYIKRVTRIVPAVLIAIGAAAILFPVPWHRIGLLYVGFLANVASLIEPERTYSLVVLWSLAVEEHFYFLWPFAVRFLNREKLIRLCLAVIVIEPIVRAIATPFCHSIWPVYLLTPFRLDGLAAGSLLSLLLEDSQWGERLKGRSWKLAVASCAAIVALFALPGVSENKNGFAFNTFGYSLTVAISFFFIAHLVVNQTSRFGKLLSHRHLVKFGTISYGFYLFHYVVIKEEEALGGPLHFHHWARLFPITFAVSYVLAWVSFHYCERHVTAWGHRFAQKLLHGGPARDWERKSINLEAADPTLIEA
jgi:peptidoglycan/LPS O-acetylase OafA/YrhL